MSDGFDRLRRDVLNAGRVRRHKHAETALNPAPDPEVRWTDLARTVFQGTQEMLEARGVSTLAASRVARRSARLVLLEHGVGVSQRVAAESLNVTERTAERDRALVRELGRDAIVDPSPGLPRIPPPPDRIVIADLEPAA